jgi:hypothetical protein
VDGAAFGTTFPHLFLMTFSNLVPDRLPPDSSYVPRVFGFRVHMSSRQRTSGSSIGVVTTSNSRPRESADNNRRLNFTRRTEPATKETAERRPKDEEAAKDAIAQDGTPALQSQDTANDPQQKGIKGANTSSKQDNSAKDDEGKKAKAGKRRNEGDGNGNGFLDNSPKRRRKSDTNGNG